MLPDAKKKQVHTIPSIPDCIEEWAAEFHKAKRVENLSSHTLEFYQWQLGYFLKYARCQVIEHISQLTPAIIRGYLDWIKETGHNPGGVHAAYRVLKTFLRWYDLEAEPEGWHNPISKVKAPKLAEEPIEPVPLVDVDKMAGACGESFYGTRDKALLLFLLDTGIRAAELLALDLADLNQVTGEVLIRAGKGRKPRTVYIQKKVKRALRAYLKKRKDGSPAVWIADIGERLGYAGLRAILKRRAKAAGVPVPTPHDFRRAFAITMLRNGCDLITLARLMGHSDLQVLRRYLKQTTDDLREAHAMGSPVEHIK